MNTLRKTYTCDCGCEKKIEWIEPLRFCLGFEDSCYGYSVCPDCEKMQTHYSGSFEGAVEFEKFMSVQDFKNKCANDEKF